MLDDNKIKVNDTEYDVSDLDDKELYVLTQVKSLRARIEKARFDLDQLVMAESAFSNTLIKSLEKETSSESNETTN
tara:strand:- start:597 stop:824 length:228 start_codon:yes stop_codon:yes gene_type:complete